MRGRIRGWVGGMRGARLCVGASRRELGEPKGGLERCQPAALVTLAFSLRSHPIACSCFEYQLCDVLLLSFRFPLSCRGLLVPCSHLQRGWLLRVPISPAIPFAADVAIWGRLLGKNIAHWPERYLERIVRRQVTDQYLPETAWIDVPRAVASRFLGAEISAGGRAPGGWIVRDAARVADVPSQCRACLEIKPKCGAVLSCWTVPPSDRPLKRSVSRYRLHQALKCELHAQRQETEESTPTAFVPSEYDPLELFSRNPAKVLCALQALRASPQNNLAGRLWVSVTGRDGQRAEALQDVGFDAVAAAAFESRSDASDLLVEAVRDVLCSEGANELEVKERKGANAPSMTRGDDRIARLSRRGDPRARRNSQRDLSELETIMPPRSDHRLPSLRDLLPLILLFRSRRAAPGTAGCADDQLAGRARSFASLRRRRFAQRGCRRANATAPPLGTF